MISVITAIYNQLNINRMFWASLSKYTSSPFELIIIDNGSTDGSPEFFESVGAKVIYNRANYSYPFCQNRGIEKAQYKWLAFLNNDLILSPQWDSRMIDSMSRNELLAATACGIEHLENREATRRLKKRWRILRNLITLTGNSATTLKLAHSLMYGNWEDFCNYRYETFKHRIKEGFVGSTIMIHREAIEKIGLWDERMQQADYDLYLRIKERSLKEGDIKPLHICLDVFIHHYIKITLKSGHPEFVDRHRLIELKDKWAPEYLALLDRLDD